MSEVIQKLKDEIDAINELALEMRDKDIQHSRTLYEKAYELSTTGEFEECHYHKGQILSLIGLGHINRISGNLYDAMTYMTQAQQISEETGMLQAIVFVNLGKIYVLLGKLLESLQAHEKALVAARQQDNYETETEALLCIANVYAMQADFSEAIRYLKQGLALSLEKHDLRLQLIASNNLASVYCYAGDYENAQLIIEQAMQLMETESYVLERTFILSTMGEIYFALGDNQSALSYYQQSLALCNHHTILETIPGILVNIGKVYKQEQRVDLEIDVLHRAISVSEQVQHMDSQRVCHQRLAEIYENQGNFEAALKHYKQFHSINEIIANEAAIQELKRLKIVHEAATHKQEAELQRLINVDLVKAKEAADVANKAKSAFLANMSHELRTPLNAILGFAQLMLYDPKLAPTYMDYLTSIIRSGEYLTELINDVLDMSRIEAKKEHFQASDFDLHQLVAELESVFSLRVQQKNLAFNIQLAPNVTRWIKGDARKLHHVLLNLIGNAVKFTTSGHIWVRINQDDSRLYFEVEDTGPGIAEEAHDTIFVAFEQTSYQHSSEKGTGLGLAISQSYVQMMGDSRITVSSEVGKGSIFRFDIPIEVSALQHHAPIPHEASIVGLQSGQSCYRILVVDDHTDSRRTLVQLLELIGFDVKEAAEGKQAVILSQAWNPHLIFMDIDMPVMDGYTAARQIKDHNSSIVIIALSTIAIDENKVIEAGFDDSMQKPLKDQLILKIISRYLRLTYEYDPQQLDEPAVLVADDKLRELIEAHPPSWQERLRHYAIAGNRDEILNLVNEIYEHDNVLANNLLRFTKNYQFGRLAMLWDSE